MKWKQSNDQIIYDLMQDLRLILENIKIYFSSQGYENEIGTIRKERDNALNTRITEIKDKSIQMMSGFNEDEDLKVTLETRTKQLDSLK